jgi:hypothetical protein
MIDADKILQAWERCKICDMSMIPSEAGRKAYIDCEYTTGLYCRIDKLMNDTISLLKEMKQVVHCKDCKYLYEVGQLQCGLKAEWFPVHEEYYCADGEKRDEQT